MKKSIASFIALSILALFTANAAEVWGQKKKSPPQQKKEEAPVVWISRSGLLALPFGYEIPENFTAQNIRPLSKLEYEKLKPYDVSVYSYCSDSHKNIRSTYEISHRITGSRIDDKVLYYKRGQQDIYGFADPYDVGDDHVYDANQILEEQVPGKSFIITFAYQPVIDESKTVDLGILTKEEVFAECDKKIDSGNWPFLNKQKEFLDKIKEKKVHLLQVEFTYKQLPGFPSVEKFDDESEAEKVFDFGDNEDVVVQIPKTCLASNYDKKNKIYRNECVTSIKINKSILPPEGVGDGNKIVLKRLFALNNKFWSCEFPESVPPLTSNHEILDARGNSFIPTILSRRHYYELFGSNLGDGYYFLDIKITKKENDYYRSTSGWKIYVPNSDYQDYFDSQLKKGMFQPSEDDNICYKIILLQNNGKYELALEAIPYKIN